VFWVVQLTDIRTGKAPETGDPFGMVRDGQRGKLILRNRDVMHETNPLNIEIALTVKLGRFPWLVGLRKLRNHVYFLES